MYPQRIFTCGWNRIDRICPTVPPAPDSAFTLNRTEMKWDALEVEEQPCEWAFGSYICFFLAVFILNIEITVTRFDAQASR